MSRLTYCILGHTYTHTYTCSYMSIILTKQKYNDFQINIYEFREMLETATLNYQSRQNMMSCISINSLLLSYLIPAHFTLLYYCSISLADGFVGLRLQGAVLLFGHTRLHRISAAAQRRGAALLLTPVNEFLVVRRTVRLGARDAHKQHPLSLIHTL